MKYPYLAARTVLATAALAALTVAAFDAQALGLGRLNVQSALGEGLRAEIDITSLSPEEAASLQVRIAPPEAFRAAGVDYNAVLSGAQATLARRADGRSYLRVTSDRAVQEPFVEIILELNSTSGRLMREFTLLFDPPGSRMAPPVQAAAPVAPVISAAPAAAGLAAAAAGPQVNVAPAPAVARPAPLPRSTPPAAPAAGGTPAPAMATAPPPAKPAPMPRPAAAAAAGRAAASPSVAVAADASRYQVRSGDTLYRVAGRTRPEGISLDQMLVGLYRANPNAFIENNVNRLRAGAVLSVPAGDELRDVTTADAQRLLTAQSADFSAYRARLAQAAPVAQAGDAGRSAQGKVQASVDDRKQSAALSPDKLKLSGGAIKASTPEAQIALANERKDNAARVAELTRNVEELKKLQQGTVAAQAPAGLPATSPAASPTTAPVTAPTTAAPPALSPPAPVAAAPAASPVAALPAVVPALPAAKPAATLPTPLITGTEAQPGLLDSITASPWLLPGAGALALLLAGFGAWRLRSRQRQAASETSFLESRMQPDSFFGASGGQRVDTRDGANSNGGTVGYSLSQLDAIGDVDPVAEADVYLAYGRDLQAEEILKEAMRAMPDRLAVRTKLLEVYAKRRDSKGFELLATQLYALTKGIGPDWAQAQELGRQFDTDNPIYQTGGHPEEIILDGERVVIEPLGATTQPHSILAPNTQPMEDSQLPEIAGGALDLDLDLDLDLSLDAPDRSAAARAMAATRPLASSLQRPADGGLDFDADERTQPSPRARAPAPRTVAGNLAPDSMRMNLDDLGGDTIQPSGDTRPGGDTTLDLGHFANSQPGGLSTAGAITPGQFDASDPVARKLELADEFRQIGDMEGARDLLEEVVAKSAGALRVKAQAMLDALG